MGNLTQETLSFSGTVISVENGIVIQKVSGDGTYTGSRLSYRDSRGSPKDKTFTSKTLEMNPNVSASLLSLKPSDSFTAYYVKNGQYSNVVSIAKGTGSSAPATHNTTTTRTSEAPSKQGYSAAGPIKGNIVSNSVILATALHGKSTGIKELKSAALLLIELHAFLESKDIEAEIAALKTTPVVATATATDTEEAF